MALDALRAPQTTLNGTYVSIEWFNAVKAELDALKAKQPTKLDRSRWGGCRWCTGFCPEVTGDPHWDYRFCPKCGRPLTEEAWAELERRMNGGTTDDA